MKFSEAKVVLKFEMVNGTEYVLPCVSTNTALEKMKSVAQSNVGGVKYVVLLATEFEDVLPFGLRYDHIIAMYVQMVEPEDVGPTHEDIDANRKKNGLPPIYEDGFGEPEDKTVDRYEDVHPADVTENDMVIPGYPALPPGFL